MTEYEIKVVALILIGILFIIIGEAGLIRNDRFIDPLPPKDDWTHPPNGGSGVPKL